MDLLRRNRQIRPIRCCGHCCLQPHCRRRRIVHIIVLKLIVISIVFSSFNDVDLFCSMLADYCMPRRRGWGTMTAVGWRRPPWLAGACICLALASSYLGTSHVRCPPTPYPTNNQPPIHPIISVNNRRMRTFQVAILCTCMVRRRLCCMVAQFHHLGVGGARWSSINDGKTH